MKTAENNILGGVYRSLKRSNIKLNNLQRANTEIKLKYILLALEEKRCRLFELELYVKYLEKTLYLAV
jgi:hypothetical protein